MSMYSVNIDLFVSSTSHPWMKSVFVVERAWKTQKTRTCEFPPTGTLDKEMVPDKKPRIEPSAQLAIVTKGYK